MKWISFFLLASFMFLSSAFSVYRPKVIYGEDNRTDLYQVQDQALISVARSTAAMFNKSDLQKMGTIYQLLTGTFGTQFNLCSNEAYFNQPIGAMCSAFLVGPDLVATAGHCISKADCDLKAFVFGYAMKSETGMPTQLAEEDVYFCKSVVKREYSTSQDYSLVQLDRPVRGYDILKLAADDVKVNEPLLVVGYPSGLPTKVAGDANVRSVEGGHFVTNLDTYGGNSGSAVFNSETLEVTGILVRGESDFKYDYANKCYRSNRCATDMCRGEDATKISFITKALNTTYLD